MELHGIGAQDIGLRESDALGPRLNHPGFKLGDVFLEIDPRRDVESPFVNAAGHMVETGANVLGQLSKGWFQLLSKPVVMTVFD